MSSIKIKISGITIVADDTEPAVKFRSQDKYLQRIFNRQLSRLNLGSPSQPMPIYNAALAAIKEIGSGEIVAFKDTQKHEEGIDY